MSLLTIFSVDPGPVNTGWVFASYDKELCVLSVHDVGISRLVDGDGWDESSIASGIWRFVTEEHKERLTDIGQVLVEFQFPTWEKPLVYAYLKNKVTELAFKSHFPPDRVRSLAPSAIKNRYHIASGSHATNKKIVYDWCEERLGSELFGAIMATVRNPDRHHICDALCQTIYWVEVSNNWPITTIRHENFHDLRQSLEELSPREQGSPLTTPPSSPDDLQNQRDGRKQPTTPRKRTLPSIIPLGCGNKRTKPRRQNPWEP